MRLLLLLVGAVACAPKAPRAVVEVRPAAPAPVRLIVRTPGGMDSLAEAAGQRVSRRLEAAGHRLQPDAELSLEIELNPVEHRLADGREETCVAVNGRVVRGGARFAAVDTVKRRCQVRRFTGGATDPLGAGIALVAAAWSAADLSAHPSALREPVLLEVLDELTDALGHQATVRN